MKIQFNKRLAVAVMWSFAVVTVLVSLGFSSREQGMMPCKGLRITVADETGNFFIEPSDIRGMLNSRGKKIKGSPISDINMGVLENIVYSNPYVSKVEVYSSIDGYVTIDIWQRDPVMRIINNDNEHFYVDDQGVFMPVSDQFTKPVVVASGFIFDDYRQKGLAFASAHPADTAQKPVLVQLNEIALFLRDNPFWDAQIEQIYVNTNSEIELIPRVGDHSILIGNTNDLEEKMENLHVFYTEAMKKTGWNQYEMINLKFKDQVVCTKKGSPN
jgi:cell division protein FtsQ